MPYIICLLRLAIGMDTPLGKVVEAASELGVPGLLLVSTCCDELDDLDGDV